MRVVVVMKIARLLTKREQKREQAMKKEKGTVGREEASCWHTTDSRANEETSDVPFQLVGSRRRFLTAPFNTYYWHLHGTEESASSRTGVHCARRGLLFALSCPEMGWDVSGVLGPPLDRA
ncbi:unnamed protein product [Calypogeia fissa]